VTGAVLASTLQAPAVDWDVTGGGGGHLESGSLSLDNTFGQPVVGAVSSGNVELCTGFWCRAEEAVGVPPVASFAAAPHQGDGPLEVAFTDTSTYTPTAWLWDLGDGPTAATQHPTHTYTSPGSYTVTLTVSNSSGSDTLVKPNYITVTTPACEPVTGVSISGPTNGVTDTTYAFTTAVSPPAATQPITYTWSPVPDSGQTTGTASFSWAITGTQTVSVTVSNCDGAGTAGDSHSIAVQAAGAENYIYLPVVVKNQ
jgi:PKD repeat protein